MKPGLHDISPGSAADGTYQLEVADGVLGLTDGGPSGTTSLVPLTTSVGGTPDLVWDENDELVLTEVVL